MSSDIAVAKQEPVRRLESIFTQDSLVPYKRPSELKSTPLLSACYRLVEYPFADYDLGIRLAFSALVEIVRSEDPNKLLEDLRQPYTNGGTARDQAFVGFFAKIAKDLADNKLEDLRRECDKVFIVVRNDVLVPPGTNVVPANQAELSRPSSYRLSKPPSNASGKTQQSGETGCSRIRTQYEDEIRLTPLLEEDLKNAHYLKQACQIVLAERSISDITRLLIFGSLKYVLNEQEPVLETLELLNILLSTPEAQLKDWDKVFKNFLEALMKLYHEHGVDKIVEDGHRIFPSEQKAQGTSEQETHASLLKQLVLSKEAPTIPVKNEQKILPIDVKTVPLVNLVYHKVTYNKELLFYRQIEPYIDHNSEQSVLSFMVRLVQGTLCNLYPENKDLKEKQLILLKNELLELISHIGKYSSSYFPALTLVERPTRRQYVPNYIVAGHVASTCVLAEICKLPAINIYSLCEECTKYDIDGDPLKRAGYRLQALKDSPEFKKDEKTIEHSRIQIGLTQDTDEIADFLEDFVETCPENFFDDIWERLLPKNIISELFS